MGKKILLADDSITIQKVIELTFSDEDFEVVTVGNGRLAIERAEEIRPDIVLCDIIMPEKDGYEVCEFIKKNPSLSSVPVLLLTGAFEPFDQERAARVGCDGFLAKPFEPAMLIGKVKDLLAQAAARPVAAPAAAVAVAPSATAFVEPPRTAEPVSSRPATDIPRFERIPTLDGTMPGPASSFITDEPILEEMAMPEEAPFEQGAAESANGGGAVSVLEEGLYGMGEAVEAAPDDFAPVSPEEAETLAASPAIPPDAEEDISSTVVFRASGLPWTQPAMETPAVLSPTPTATADPYGSAEPAGFEEVFDEDLPAPPPAFEPSAPAVLEASVPSMPPPAPTFEPEPEPPSPPPTVETLQGEPPQPSAALDLPEEVSFADLAPAAPAHPPASPSAAAEVAVPVDLVAQIAQRVVAQISERVVREVAWEVIPELAEALINKEIERLKAELQNS
jgi:CheY-like chemotaxis protein